MVVAAVGEDHRLYGLAVLVLKLNRVEGGRGVVVVVVYGLAVVVGRGVVVVRRVVVVVGRRVVVVVVVVVVVGTEGSSMSSIE